MPESSRNSLEWKFLHQQQGSRGVTEHMGIDVRQSALFAELSQPRRNRAWVNWLAAHLREHHSAFGPFVAETPSVKVLMNAVLHKTH